MSGIRRKREYRVAEALTSAVGGLPSSAKVWESLAFAYWPRIVGDNAAAATEPESVRDGILFVRTKSSVWSHEMSVMKAHLVTELNKSIGRPVIRDIIFRAQGISRGRPKGEGNGEPTEDDLKLISLPPEEQAHLQIELDRLDTIPDDGIRNAVARRIARDRKLRWWRLQHGWKPCKRCSVPHNTDGALCPICRLSR